MKTKLHFKLLALIIMLFSLNSNAQFIDYEGRDTKWNIGINTGGVWQDGDVKLHLPGFGYGFTIGKGIYEDPNHFWSIDLRFRYMKGCTFGQDSELSDITNNPIYADPNTDYIGSITSGNYVGKSFLNTKTDIHDFNLEGVLNVFWLRKHTGVLLSVFGGLGVTDYRTRTNLLDGDDKIYNYLRLSNQTNPSTSDIRGVQDKTYESFANFNQDKQQIKFMPSLGVSVGYQITPQLSFGLEHRVTFTLADKFDGVEKVGTQFLQWGNNDKYHYSSIFLRWNIFKETNSTTTSNNDKCKPYVKIIKLKDNTVRNEFIEIKTRVTKIESNNDVILSNNDSSFYTIYNKSTDYVTGTVKLKKGINRIYFFASNRKCENMDSTIIIYDPNYCPKPFVKIIEPAAKNEVSKVKLIAEVNHIEKATIEVKLNNKIINYTFNKAKDTIFADLDLVKNNNYINIRAINSCGDTILAKHVIFKEKPCFPPVATISTPVNGRTYETKSISFVAKTTNIDNVNQVSFWLNGKLHYTTYDASSKTISTNLDLVKGNNSITLKVKNKCGEDVKSVNFIYKEGCKAPVIFSMTPNANKTVNTSRIAFNGNVQNVKLVDQVHLKVNGVEINSGYTTKYGQAYTTITLKKGRNKIEFSATNECGTDSKTVYILYRCVNPFINITAPFNGANSNVQNIPVTALVNGAKTPQSIKVKLNGVPKVFYFDSTTNTVTANVALRQGQNTIEVTATNDCKTVSKTISVSHNQSCPKPVVSINSPSNGASFTTNYITLSGTATNIISQNQLRIVLNGVNKSFTYNASSKTFNGTLNLKEGSNTVVITATTNCGTDTKTITIIYSKPCPKPEVNITSHGTNSNSTSQNILVRGNANNVTSQSQLKAKVNGVSKSISYNSITKVFNFNTGLASGNNTIIITATTSCGTVSKTIYVNYSQNCPKPVVVITSPLHGNIITSKTVSFGGTVTNINSQSELKVTVNGVNQAFSYNTSVRAFSGNATLVSGNNVIVVTATTNCGTDSKTVTVLSRCAKPTLNIISPNNGMNYPMSNIPLAAITSGVNSKNQIVLKQNGSNVNFNFNTSTSKIDANLVLKEGNNSIVVSVTNNCGTVSKSINLNYTKPCPKPVVSISSPTNGSTVNVPQISVTGTALNVSNQSQISIKANGIDKVFTFNTSTKIFNGTIALIQGNNTITVTATTNCGTSTKTINVIYVPCTAPTVTNNKPTMGQVFTTAAAVGEATVLNVSSKSQLTVTLNGNNIPFTFTGNKVTANLALKSGGNTFKVKANSTCGKDEKTTTFTYKKPCLNPTVSISSPTNFSTYSTENITLTAAVSNYDTKSNITVKLNGSNITFNLNTATNTVSANVKLKEGSNVIVIFVSNNCGLVKEATVGVNYVIPCKTPVLFITSPANGTISASQTITVRGTVQNITTSSNLTVLLNGTSKNITYNNTTKTFAAVLTLANGNNTIKVEAGSVCGNNSKTINVTYNQIINPIVTVFTPLPDTTNTTANQIKIGGTIEKITKSSQLVIRVNNVIQKGVTLSKINATKFEFNGLLNLAPGVNVITFKGTHTSGGTHQKVKTVIVSTNVNKLKGGLKQNEGTILKGGSILKQ